MTRKKKFTQRLLSGLMAFVMGASMVLDVLPAMAAYGDLDTTTYPKAELVMDFLGDNKTTYNDGTAGSGIIQGPSDSDQQSADGGADGKWNYYINGEQGDGNKTILWIGIGIKDVDSFVVANGGKGLYSAELGLVYDPNYLEPYVDPAQTDFQSTIAHYNIGGNAKNQWPDSYQVTEALAGVDPRNDGIDTLAIGDPTIERYGASANAPAGYGTQEFGANAGWKMVYLSFQQKEGATDTRFTDTASYGEKDTYYIAMVPFLLKNHPDAVPGAKTEDLRVRLVRNAAVFSMASDKVKGKTDSNGVGEYGDGEPSFGNWDKYTYHDPQHDLKLMLDYTGDLNLFTGKRVRDEIKADLLVRNVSGSIDNYARLIINNEPLPSPSQLVSGDGKDKNGTYGNWVNHGSITGLSGGEEMLISIHAGTGYTAALSITTTTGLTISALPVTTPDSAFTEEHTFIVPTLAVKDGIVAVNVEFSGTGDQDTPFDATLIVNDGGYSSDPKAARNDAQMSFSPADKTQILKNGSETIQPTAGTTVTVTVRRHRDYTFYPGTTATTVPTLKITATGDGSAVTYSTVSSSVSSDGLVYTHTYTFTMPSSDVEVEVDFHLAEKYTATVLLNTDSGVGEAGNWALLSANGDPPNTAKATGTGFDPVGGNNSFELTNGRVVTIETACVPGYKITGIEFIDISSNTTISNLEADDLPGSPGNYTFTMPAQDVLVIVHVGLIQEYKVQLVIVDGDTTAGEGARLAHNGTVPTPTDLWLTQAQVYALQGGDTSIIDILKVLAGAQISVVPTYVDAGNNTVVGLRPGRTISVDVKYPAPASATGWDTIVPSGSASSGYSFNMIALDDPDNDKVVVTVTFEDEPRPSLTARIKETRPSDIDAGTTALWQVYQHKNDITAFEGDSLVVDIHLEPGDYIAGVIIKDFDEIPLGVPVSCTGIGYNNGAGGNETATFEMQNVNTAIHIIYGHGIPPKEPTYTATIRKTGAPATWNTRIENNTQNTADPSPTGWNLTYAQVDAHAGDKVTGIYTNVAGAFVKGEKVTADVLGTTVPWYYGPNGEVVIKSMPAANVTINVEMEEIDLSKAVDLTVAKDESAATTLGTNANNKVSTTVSGGTAFVPVTAAGDDTKSAQPGEFVKVKVDVAPGYHIDHVVVSDGTLISHALSGNGYNGGAGGTEWVTFNMADPGKNTTVTVYYADGVPENTLTVKVTEPAGGNNSGDVTPDGEPTGTATMAAPWGPKVVAPGTLVTIKANPQSGYFLKLPILESPSGLITLNWVDLNTFTFVMPAEPLTVTLPFDNDPDGPDQFHANLILRPDGTSITSLPTGTKGSFEDATGGYVRLDANTCIYSRTALPGENVPYSVYVPDGYYISEVSVTPDSLGVVPTITGMIGKQRGDFTMPAANVYLNITISKGWPDQVEYPVRLHVTAPNTAAVNSYATLDNLANADPAITVPGTTGVTSAVGTVKAMDGDKMQVVLLPDAAHTLKSVRLEDGAGAPVSYTWTTDGAGHLALEFNVPGSSVDVYVEYEMGTPTPHKVTLVTKGLNGQTVELKNGTSWTVTHTTSSTGPDQTATPGQKLDLSITGSEALIKEAYAQDSDGNLISLSNPALAGRFVVADNVAVGNPYGFIMPYNVDVTVYVTMDTTVAPPADDEHILTLLAKGDAGSGTVLVTDTSTNKQMSATATGSNAMVAKDNAKITAKVTPAAGYALYSLIAYLDDGTRVLVSMDNKVAAGDTYTFTMPAATTHIEAEFRAVEPNAYQIQVVVNNTVNGGLGTGNDANLYQPVGGANFLGKFKDNVSAGETFDLAFTIEPGYQLDTIIAVPQGSGVVANIPLPTTVGGRTQVKMPASDLVIYVTFKMDTTTRFDVIGKILYDGTSAAPTAGKGVNMVTLTGETSNPTSDSVRSGADSGGVDADDALIQEAADKRVEATWSCANGYVVANYEVVTAVGGNYVLSQPFDRDGDGVIDGLFFMMQPEPVEVRVTFVDTTKDQPKDFTATLHYVTPDADDTATLKAPNRNPASAYTVTGDAQVIHSLHVGDKLNVTGTTNGTGWIRTIYVLQKTPAAANGQMIYTYSPSGGIQAVTDTDNIHFFMPSGDVDVYVEFSATQPQPDEHTAVLTVSGPASANPATNYAVLTEDGSSNTTGKAECNQGPKSMVTTTGKTIRLTVTVDAAHEIDTINGTPISLLLKLNPVPGSNGLVYTFDMPASDVGIMVILKEKAATRYDLHLYTKNIGLTALDTDPNKTTVAYGTAAGEFLTNTGTMPTGSDPVPTLQVPAGRPVTLTVEPIAGYYVDAAYAVTGYGLVKLTPDPATRPAGYGGKRLTDVGLEGATIYDIGADTNVATFTMPAATTDVYVYYKQGTPPTTPWYNLVVIATDTGAPTANVGVNYAAVAADDGAVPTPTTHFKPSYDSDGYTLLNPASDPYAVASTGVGATYYSLSAGDAIHMNATNSGTYTVGTTKYVYQYDANTGMVLTTQTLGTPIPGLTNEDTANHPRGELQGFTMPASNTSVRVNFETVRAKNLWAGLHVTYNSPLDRDKDSWHTSTGMGNKVEMSVDDPSHRYVNNDYDLFPEDDDHNRLKDLVANETVTTIAWPTTGVQVLQVVVTRIAADGVTPLGSVVAVHPGGNSYTFAMGDESVEVYVVLATDDVDHYVAYATPAYKDGLTAADGWLVPLKDGGGVTNETTAGLPKADFWTEAQPKDQIKTVFEAKTDVYAEVKAYRDDTGAEIPLAQFGVGNGSRGYATTEIPDPGSDVHIVVTFSKDPPPPQKLTLENKDHKNQAGNTAKLTIDDTTLSEQTYALQPDTTALDPMSHLFADPVTPGTGLDLDGTTAAGGYRVKQVDVKVTTDVGDITITYYWKEIGGTYQLVDGAGNPVNLVMPTKTTTVTVIYDQDVEGVVPYDPDNRDTTTYPIDNHIVAENRGDYLVVTVPMLNMKSDLTTADATSVDGDVHTFDLYLQTDFSATVDPSAGTVTPEPTKVTNLLTFSNPKVFYEDATLPASGSAGFYEYQDKYELKNFYDAEHTSSTLGLDGARFIVEIKSDDEIEADVDADSTVTDKTTEKAARKANAAILRAIMDNDGTMSAANKYHMYITATTHDTPGTVSANDVVGGYVDFVVPKYYAIVGKLESYAPTHIATFTADAGLTEEYKGQYPFVSTLVGDAGVELWSQDFVVKLTSDWDKIKGKEITLTIEKAGHVTYTRTAIKMIDSDTNAENIGTDGTTKLYNATAKTFTIETPIRLIAGDLDGNGAVKARDVNIMSDFLHGAYKWTTAATSSDAGWDNSVYNPESLAYVADLNGDGAVTSRDLDLMLESQNYNKSTRTYGSPSGLKNGGVKFFSARRAPAMIQGFPQWAYERIMDGADLPDWVWDALDEDLYLPEWAVELVRCDMTLPQWAVDMALSYADMPQWALDKLVAGETLPQWAAELILAGEALPDWAQLLLEAGEALPEEPLTEEEIAALLTPELPEELPLPEGEVPAEGEKLPVEGEETPVEGEELPEEGGEKPAEGEIPEESETPDEEEKAPGQDGELPTEDETDPDELPGQGTAEEQPLPAPDEEEKEPTTEDTPPAQLGPEESVQPEEPDTSEEGKEESPSDLEENGEGEGSLSGESDEAAQDVQMPSEAVPERTEESADSIENAGSSYQFEL